jgi:hypothetical protein
MGVLRGTMDHAFASLVSLVDMLCVLLASNRLVVPSVKFSTVGSWAFPVAGPQLWNDLPMEVTSAQSLSIFRQRLET